MTPDEWGVRPEDLTPAERQALEKASTETQAAHAAALQLGERLEDLPPPSIVRPPPESLLARVRHRKARRTVLRIAAAALALAATALLMVGIWPEEEGQRDRGAFAPPPGSVHIQAAAEGPRGPRALAEGDAVANNEGVLFRAQVDYDGYLFLTEVETGAVVWPPEGEQWEVTAGQDATVGGDALLAWRPDRRLERATYRLWLCPHPKRNVLCVYDELTLTWN